MTDQRVDGFATKLKGKAQDGLGRLTGDDSLRAEGGTNQIKGKAQELYGQAMDKLDSLVDRAPVSVQDRARSTIQEARKRPLLTTAIVAGLGLILARSGSRRG